MEYKFAHIIEVILQRMLAAQEKLRVRIKAIYVFGSFCTKDFQRSLKALKKPESSMDRTILRKAESVSKCIKRIEQEKQYNLFEGSMDQELESGIKN